MVHNLSSSIEDCEYCQKKLERWNNLERWNTPSGVIKMPQNEPASPWPAVMVYISSLMLIAFLVWVFFG